jgi:hypothetical protein
MSALPATVFANPDVRLRVWFNDGARGFQKLNPDQRMAAAGYALNSASVADAAVTSAKLADGSVTPAKLQFGSALRVDADGVVRVENLAAFTGVETHSGSGEIHRRNEPSGSNFTVEVSGKPSGVNPAAFDRLVAVGGLAAAQPVYETITSDTTRILARGPARGGQFTIERDAGLGRLYFQEWFSTAGLPLLTITLTFRDVEGQVTSTVKLAECRLLSYKMHLPESSLGVAVREIITIRYARMVYP